MEPRTTKTKLGVFRHDDIYFIADELSEYGLNGYNIYNEIIRQTGICKAALTRVFKARLSDDEIYAILTGTPPDDEVWMYNQARVARLIRLQNEGGGDGNDEL